MWSEEDLADITPEKADRYSIYVGKFVPAPKPTYKFISYISSSPSLEVIRSRAAKHFKLGKDILIVDILKPALIGNLWAIKQELELE